MSSAVAQEKQEKSPSTKASWGQIFRLATIIVISITHIFLAVLICYFAFLLTTAFAYRLITVFLVVIYLSNIFAKISIDIIKLYD